MAKVLHILWDGDKGSVQRYLSRLVLYPGWNETEHGLCFLNREGSLLNSELMPGFPLFHLDLSHPWLLHRARPLLPIINKWGADIVHCHTSSPAFHVIAAAISEKPLIYSHYGESLFKKHKHLLYNLLWKLNRNKWKKILHPSYFAMNHFLKEFPWLEPQSTVLMPPVLEENREGIKNKEDSAPFKIGFFSPLAHHKGPDLFIQVIAKIIEKIPKTEGYLYGAGKKKGELLALANYLGLGAHVHFEEAPSNQAEEMAQMDLILIPSRLEPTGFTALEAQSTGVPVIAFKQSGSAEAILENETGILVPVGEVEAMAEAAVDLLSNPNKLNAFSIKAKIHAENHFSLDDHVVQLETLYRTISPVLSQES